MRFRPITFAALAVGALVAACDYGTTQPPTHVADTSAVLHGSLHTDEPGSTVTWWFEYGTTTALGSSTPERSTTYGPGASTVLVEATVTGLAEDTTYHYRSCVRNAAGGGVCGAIQSFSTTTERDSVHGTGIVTSIPELGYVQGVSIEASSVPDGTEPSGSASRAPGVVYFRLADEGLVTCLRVEGNRAAVGFVADYTPFDPSLPLVPVVLHVEDNGPTGDRYVVTLPDEAPTACPDPDDQLDAVAGSTIVRGDLVVHDHP